MKGLYLIDGMLPSKHTLLLQCKHDVGRKKKQPLERALDCTVGTGINYMNNQLQTLRQNQSYLGTRISIALLPSMECVHVKKLPTN